MKKITFIILLLTSMFTVSVKAQPSDDSLIILYAEAITTPYQAELLLLDANNFEGNGSISLPTELGHPDARLTAQVSVAQDARYIVLHQILEGDAVQQSLRLYDNGTQTCCVDLGALVNGAAFYVGGFDPAGTRFAFSYVEAASINEVFPAGGIAIYDASQGVITHNIPMADVLAAINGEPYGVWARMGEWTEQGILFVPNCYGCEGVFSGEFSAYNPDTNTYIAQTGILFHNWLGKRLDATNEFLLLNSDERYSYDPTLGMFPIPNVVLYNPTAITYPQTSGTVIFASDDMIVLDSVFWINDGNAFLVESVQDGLWAIRDRVTGQIQYLNHEPSEGVLGGLPNGWLSRASQPDGLTVIKFWDAATLSALAVFTYETPHNISLIQSPALGESLTPVTAFSEIAAPDDVIVQCPGALPSRLLVDETARVTPGEPNNLREFASTDSQLIGQIPGGASFLVLEGPVCDGGFAWWRVRYDNQEGWTVEGSADTYWTELAP